jgi:hypothetical protein
MPGYFTPGLPLVGGPNVTGSVPYPRLNGAERLPADTAQQFAASVAVTPFQIAAFTAAVLANTVTEAAGAATLSTENGLVTSASQTTVAGGTYVLTLTNTLLTTTSALQAAAYSGTNTGGAPEVTSIVVSSGSAVITVTNTGSTAFNGTLKVAFSIAQF